MVTVCKDLSIGDFTPFSGWSWTPTEVSLLDPVFTYAGRFEKDDGTGKLYMIQSNTALRLKNAGLIVWSAAAHVMMAAARAFHMLTLYAFKFDCSIPLRNRLAVLSRDAVKLVATPLLIAGLESSAVLGVVFPKEGRKLYASFERFAHVKLGIQGLDLFGRDSPYCAPCYQPYFGMTRPPQ